MTVFLWLENDCLSGCIYLSSNAAVSFDAHENIDRNNPELFQASRLHNNKIQSSFTAKISDPQFQKLLQ